jgi:hypothetical protein
LAAHEGHTIYTAKKPKTIHLITKHGAGVTDVMLKQRLTDAVALFKKVRNDKTEAQRAIITANTKTIAELQKSPASPRRDDKIAKLQVKINDSQQLVSQYAAIDEKNRDAVFDTLDKWAKSLPHMVSKEVTHFTDDAMMETVVQAAISASQARIDAAFTEPDGSAKPNGSQGVITHPAPPGLGAGYELDPNNLAVPISRALTTLVLRLVVADSVQRHFMIETAYFE